MKTQLLSSIAGLAMVAGGLTGFGTGSALADDVIIDIPENCHMVPQDLPKGVDGIIDIQCDLPPECEYVTTDNGGPFQSVSLECDLERGCELLSGEFFGVSYWYIECDESECIGGCNPLTPPGIGFTAEAPRGGPTDFAAFPRN
jgi:hypothetical protein